MQEKLRVGVVGLGWAGQQHVREFAAHPDTEVVALAGLEVDVRDSLAAEYGIAQAFDDWKDLVALPDVDIVSIATPTFLHAPIAIAALEAGKHVLTEKPIAANAAEGMRMVEAARAAGRVLDVVFNHRRRGDVAAIKELMDAGGIGKPYYAKAWWWLRAGIPKIGSWFTRSQLSGGGPLIDIGVHILDYTLYLLGNPKPVSVSGVVFSELGPAGKGGAVPDKDSEKSGAIDDTFDVEDLGSAIIRFENNLALTLETSWALYRSPGDNLGISIHGTEGAVELESQDYAEATVRVFRDGVGPDGERVDDDSILDNLEHRAHDAVIEDFVAMIQAGPMEWPKYDGSVGLERARIIDAIYESARTGKEVAL